LKSLRSTRSLVIICAFGVLAFVVLSSLGAWQVYRLDGKLDLIERVEQRVAAPVSAVPDSRAWSSLQPDDIEYRHVEVTGTLMPELSVRVTATTEYGRGYWLMTPLKLGNGSTVMINRGFVSGDFDLAADAASMAKSSEPETFRGLLRVSEPDGGFLRANRPQDNRWYSRDTEAIAKALDLEQVAPFFIDVEADEAETASSAANPSPEPVPGLTVIHFRNSHLVYAVTWFVLALMVAGGLVLLLRDRVKPGS
jgi:surfeit locus 1 family protein